MLSRVVFLVAVAGATSAVLAQPPSFILFFPDQLRSQEIGCYGNTVAQTPTWTATGTWTQTTSACSWIAWPARISRRGVDRPIVQDKLLS